MGRLIGYIAAAILLFFGVLFVWGAFSPEIEGSPVGSIIVGIISIGAGLGLIWLVGRRAKQAAEAATIIQKIELSGDVNLEKMTCRNCGGALSSEHIKVITGAPFVHCPYCGTSYQLSEEPKW